MLKPSASVSTGKQSSFSAEISRKERQTSTEINIFILRQTENKFKSFVVNGRGNQCKKLSIKLNLCDLFWRVSAVGSVGGRENSWIDSDAIQDLHAIGAFSISTIGWIRLLGIASIWASVRTEDTSNIVPEMQQILTKTKLPGCSSKRDESNKTPMNTILYCYSFLIKMTNVSDAGCLFLNAELQKLQQ